MRVSTQKSRNRYINIFTIKNIYISNHDARSCRVVVMRVENYKRFDFISNFLTHIIFNKC